MGINFSLYLHDASCIEDWASERYCDHFVCLCVCLSVNPNPNPNDVLGIRPYIAKYTDIPIQPKLGRAEIAPSVGAGISPESMIHCCGLLSLWSHGY